MGIHDQYLLFVIIQPTHKYSKEELYYTYIEYKRLKKRNHNKYTHKLH